MRIRVSTILVTALLCLAPTASWADLAPYSQDFEGLVQEDPDALANDGWLVFGNVFDPGWNYLYGYGPFVAPNGGPAFCAVVSGEGGPFQGAQQLSVYNDYNNGDHANGNLVEANVFQEQTVGAADVGGTWLFEFDAKRGNIEGGTTALAFFKTLDPNAGFALTNFITVDMTGISDNWGSYALLIFIDPSLEGQILQFGFLSVATDYEGAGIFYDNVSFGEVFDEDADGIFDGSDICPGTVIPESVPTNQLGVNRWALVDDDGVFDTTPPPGGGGGPEFEFTVADTRGCSCEQIIEAWSLGWGHSKFGCSTGVMLQWKAAAWNLQLAQPESESRVNRGGLTTLDGGVDGSSVSGTNGTSDRGTQRRGIRGR